MSEFIKEEKESFIIFTLKGSSFGIHAMQVREILRVPEIIPLPQAFSFMEGVVNVRDRVLPVIDLRKRFQMEADNKASNRLLIIRLPKVLVGLIVDSVKEVIDISLSTIQKPVETEIEGLGLHGISGIARAGKDLILLPDITSILRVEEQDQLAAIRRRKEPASP